MRITLLHVYWLVACAKPATTNEQARSPSESAPAAQVPQAAPAQAPPADAEPAQAAPSRHTMECAEVIIAEDVIRACKVTGELKNRIGVAEGKYPEVSTCQRLFFVTGERQRTVTWTLGVHPTARDATLYLAGRLASKDAKRLAGLGDVAWTEQYELSSAATDYHVVVRKGRLVIELVTKESHMSETLCTLDQLVELAKIGTARLP
jgi:hypothetical protein